MKPDAIVYVQGYEFRVVRSWSTEHGFRFIGECTASSRNDRIRGTGYDGAEYSYSPLRDVHS